VRQSLHGSATTTHAVPAAIQRSKAPIQKLAEQYELNRKTVRKSPVRTGVQDAGPQAPCSMIADGRGGGDCGGLLPSHAAAAR
jgi:hypothetical protein